MSETERERGRETEMGIVGSRRGMMWTLGPQGVLYEPQVPEAVPLSSTESGLQLSLCWASSVVPRPSFLPRLPQDLWFLGYLNMNLTLWTMSSLNLYILYLKRGLFGPTVVDHFITDTLRYVQSRT